MNDQDSARVVEILNAIHEKMLVACFLLLLIVVGTCK